MNERNTIKEILKCKHLHGKTFYFTSQDEK